MPSYFIAVGRRRRPGAANAASTLIAPTPLAVAGMGGSLSPRRGNPPRMAERSGEGSSVGRRPHDWPGTGMAEMANLLLTGSADAATVYGISGPSAWRRDEGSKQKRIPLL